MKPEQLKEGSKQASVVSILYLDYHVNPWEEFLLKGPGGARPCLSKSPRREVAPYPKSGKNDLMKPAPGFPEEDVQRAKMRRDAFNLIEAAKVAAEH